MLTGRDNRIHRTLVAAGLRVCLAILLVHTALAQSPQPAPHRGQKLDSMSTRARQPDSAVVKRSDSSLVRTLDSVFVRRPDSSSVQRVDSGSVRWPDSTLGQPADSALMQRPDSLIRWDLRRWAGSFTLSADTAQALTAEKLQWIAPLTLGHAIATLPGFYLVDQSSVGQYLRPTVRGVDWRGIGILLDGIPAADPSTGTVNLSLFPVSIADRIEIITGPRSFLYGSGAVGGAINILTRRESHTLPSTAIRYSESGYSYASSDGSFNQDISRRVNVAAGYQYQGTDGRFDNTGHEQWNMRGSVRYHPARAWDITLGYLYSQTQTGLNDGIDLGRTGTALAFLPQQATVRNADAYEKLTRHDLSVRLAGSFFSDSTNLTTVTMYTSRFLREYRDEENRTSPNGIFLQQNHRVAWSGLQLRQRFEVGAQTITGGAHLEDRRITESPSMGVRQNPAVSGWLLDEIALGSAVVWSLFGRVDHVRGKTHNGAGTDVRVQLGDVVSLKGGLSISARPSSYAEAFWDDSTIIRASLPDAERHLQGEAGVRVTMGTLGNIEATYAYRRIDDPILFDVLSATAPRPKILLRQGDFVTVHSLELALNMRIAFIMVEGTAAYVRQTDASGTALQEIPQTYARGGVYYRDRIIGGALELQAGVRGQFRGAYFGSTLIGETLFPLPNTQVRLGMASTVDLVLIAHIGDAYIHFLWENLASTEYFTTPFTPALDRSIRFGVTWEFSN